MSAAPPDQRADSQSAGSQSQSAVTSSVPPPTLADGLRPFLDALSGRWDAFELTGTINAKIDGKPATVTLLVRRIDREAFDFEAALSPHEESVIIRRRTDRIDMALPKHRVVFTGSGHDSGADHLQPAGLTQRIFSPASQISGIAMLAFQSEPATAATLLTSLLKTRFDADAGQWVSGEVSFQFPMAGCIVATHRDITARFEVTRELKRQETTSIGDDWQRVPVERAELERTLSRGVRRALEIVAPSPLLTNPPQTVRKVPNGELQWVGGQRVVMLQGSPEEIGRAHGLLLRDEAMACIDSVLHTFGTVQTIRSGRWFRHDLDDAWARLNPHIPERHRVETRAMAQALELDEHRVETLNVFPELFHCSGFAVFNSATVDGTLYHGRVLDYMTTIGLQDSATTFIVRPDGMIPFANVGYAGFIGSVSGMNAQAVSLGEMGGRGEGQWDGVPMATLMRRALEECSTLDDVMKLWRDSPRTCEYYYVFADGKSNRAVGVAATPESIEFVMPGQAHPRLGDGIPDTVVLSAGSRLETLRQRVQEHHGKIDAEAAMWLMSRPVAMQSNLHNVLFVPAQGVLYVANADHKRPAAECPYVRLDLRKLLAEIDTAAE